MKFETAFEKP